MKKVSVIIPVYNTSRYIAKCLDSVVSQSYNNIEIIIVNDGSTDGSLDICRKYQSGFDNIIVIDKEKTGQSDSRYQGFLKSTGDYIYCVDSDDYINIDTIEILVKGIERHEADMFYARARLVDLNGKRLAITPKYVTEVLADKETILGDALLSKNIKPAMWVKLARRSLWEKCYTQEARNIRLCEDYLLTVLFASYSSKVAFTNHIIYNVLQRKESLSREPSSLLVTGHDDYFPIIREEIRRMGLQDKLSRHYYTGFARIFIYTLITAATNSDSFSQYCSLFLELSEDSVFYDPAFKRSISIPFRFLARLVRVPRLFYHSARLYSIFKKH